MGLFNFGIKNTFKICNLKFQAFGEIEKKNYHDLNVKNFRNCNALIQPSSKKHISKKLHSEDNFFVP